jgi:enoyl-CoA hydratase
MPNLIEYRLQDTVATIVIDDGKVNVMSLAMQAELNRALDRAVADRAVVVLTGRSGILSAGFDLPVLTAGGPQAHDMVKGGFELAERLLSFPTPTVVACTGHALAMGAFLLLSADYRIGTVGAYKIAANEVAIGMTVPYFALALCRHRLNAAQLLRATTLAEIFAPEQALQAGFLDELATAENLPQVAQAKAVQLAKLNMSAHAATKLRLRESLLATVRAALARDDREFGTRQ